MEKTKELFENWNNEKIKIEFTNDDKNKKIVKGEIWIAKIGINIGSEISKDGKFLRPVLILNNKMGGDLVFIVPITTSYNKNFSKYLFEINNYNKVGLIEKSYFSLNNVKSISKKRLIYKINNVYKLNKYYSKVSNNILDLIKKEINLFL